MSGGAAGIGTEAHSSMRVAGAAETELDRKTMTSRSINNVNEVCEVTLVCM